MQRWIQIYISATCKIQSSALVGLGVAQSTDHYGSVTCELPSFAGAAPPLGAIALPRRGAADDYADDMSDHTE